jgi:dihydroflavonol-4-reductase
MRVFLTGATGFLGSHVARQLVAAGHAVRALARPRADRTLLDDVPEIEWVVGDVCEPASLVPAVRDCEAVIHTAASVTFRRQLREQQRAINVEGTRHLLAAAQAAGVRRFVQTSSVAAVGRPAEGGIADEEARYDFPPGLAYNESKRDSELLVRRAGGLETVCLNPALVVGPGDFHRRLLPLFRAVKWGLLPLVPPGGTTLCDVRDVAGAHVNALTAGQPGARYLLGGPHLTLRELATAIARLTRGAPPLVELPASVVRLGFVPLALLERAGVPLPFSTAATFYLVTHGYYSSARAQAELGYHVRPAEETLGDAARWYASQQLL